MQKKEAQDFFRREFAASDRRVSEIADQLGCGHQTIRNWVEGVTEPSFSNGLQLLEALGWTLTLRREKAAAQRTFHRAKTVARRRAIRDLTTEPDPAA